MKRWIISLNLLQVLGLLCFNASPANTPGQRAANTVQQVSEAELAERFNAILDEELSGDKVCVATSAARQLDALMKDSAATVVREKAFNRVTEAEKNIRAFAKALLEKGAAESGRVSISTFTITMVMHPRPSLPSPGQTKKSLFCPLFPIC